MTKNITMARKYSRYSTKRAVSGEIFLILAINSNQSLSRTLLPLWLRRKSDSGVSRQSDRYRPLVCSPARIAWTRVRLPCSAVRPITANANLCDKAGLALCRDSSLAHQPGFTQLTMTCSFRSGRDALIASCGKSA